MRFLSPASARSPDAARAVSPSNVPGVISSIDGGALPALSRCFSPFEVFAEACVGLEVEYVIAAPSATSEELSDFFSFSLYDSKISA